MGIEPQQSTIARTERDRAEALSFLRAGAAIAVVFLLAYLILNLGSLRAIPEDLLLDNVAALLAAALFLGFTFTSPFPGYRDPATLVFYIILITLFVRISATISDAQPRLMAVVLCPLAAALLAGWSPRWQLALNVACLAGFAAAEYMIPIADRDKRYHWLWLFAALAISQAATVLLDRRNTDILSQRRALDEAARRRERRAETIAHEVRSPLAALSGFLSLLQDGELSEQERAKVLSRMGSVARRMELLVDNLVELGRFDTGRPEAAGRAASPDTVAADVARMWAEEARNSGASMVTEFGCGSSVEVDRTFLERIFSNLLANVVGRGGAGEIRFKTALLDGKIAIEVSDNGPEVGAAEADRMFERPESYEGGAGAIRLGMFVARTLVESRGGKIEARASSDHHGLRISAEVPLESIRKPRQ